MQTGRNKPCPCGSGKKYKKCCLTAEYQEIGREDSIRGRLVQDLLQFFDKNYHHTLEDAHMLFWYEFDLEKHLDHHSFEIASQNFMEWIIHDYIVDFKEDNTLIDLYLKKNRNLSADEYKVIMMMKHSIISLYEVREVFPDKGLLLKDLLLGEEYDVKEKMASRSLSKWDIYATRLLYIDGQYVMSGSIYPYPLKQKERILEHIHAEFEDFKLEFPGTEMDDFLKNDGYLFNFYWYDLFENPALPAFHTTDGEPMMISNAVFDINNKEAVISALSKMKDISQDGEHFTWRAKKNSDGQSIILGWIKFSKTGLTLECHSKKRLDMGKQILLKALPDALFHKVDTFQDPMEALKEYEKKPQSKPENEIPMEVQQKLYTEFQQKHCEKWIKEPVPALNGKTPQQAVKTKAGKAEVIELLKFFENAEERNKKNGAPYYDISWMWDRLGLKRED
ncbi:SEC-C domain-containing protein [bacterium]|nr:SEC-C domain-containing protein [bacterium]